MNLIIIALTQFLVYFFLLTPLLQFMNLSPSLDLFHFSLLCFSTLCIAAGGYIINDINDIEIDQINKPGKNQVGQTLSLALANKLYYVITTIGIAIGVYLSIVLREQYLSLVNVFCAALLWTYATYLKRTMIAGNALVAVLTACSILVILAFEPLSYEKQSLIWIIGAYAFFAFLTNFVRELIKDLEDVDGDRRGNAWTLAVKGGTVASKILIAFLLTVTMACLAYIQYLQIEQNEIFLFLYLGLSLQLPLLLLFVFLWSFDGKKAYYRLGIFTKLIMLSGIISIFVFYKLFIS